MILKQGGNIMCDFQLTTPVAFIIFNRPNLTKKVFEEIRRAKPPRLYIIADGPRTGQEWTKCLAARDVAENIDWNCQVFKNYSNFNLGCGKRTASGLDWVFSLENEAIIFDDDCLPHPTLFRFYQEMLNRYRTDDRIVSIGGNNYRNTRQRMDYSYHFSRFPHVWGWATWRRVWQKFYDYKMSLWPLVRESNLLKDIFCSIEARSLNGQDDLFILSGKDDVEYWRRKFDVVHSGQFNTWDYQFFLAAFLQNGLAVLPNVNLVSNIGFGEEASSTTTITELANVPTEPITFPLKHPPFMIRDAWDDAYMQLIFKRSC